jgi:HEAT repeat protein
VTAQTQQLDGFASALSNGNTEQKRDALFQIRNLRSEMASRIAVPALRDRDPIVRATAAASVVFLPKSEAVNALTPLLEDKDAFVRKEAAYALGRVESGEAAGPLIRLLQGDKDLEVQAAAAIGLGQTGSPTAVEPLTAVLKRRPSEESEFLRRSSARSIGRIAQIIKTGNAYTVTPQNFLPERYKSISGDDLTTAQPVFASAVTVLTTVLQNRLEFDDTRREAAYALGAIGSRSATNTLESHRKSTDPYLAEISKEALLKINSSDRGN